MTPDQMLCMADMLESMAFDCLGRVGCSRCPPDRESRLVVLFMDHAARLRRHSRAAPHRRT